MSFESRGSFSAWRAAVVAEHDPGVVAVGQPHVLHRAAARASAKWERIVADSSGRPSRPTVVQMQSSVRLGPVAACTAGRQPHDAAVVRGVGVDLLLDEEPAAAEPLGSQPQPPAQVQASADLADGGVDQLEPSASPNQRVERRPDVVDGRSIRRRPAWEQARGRARPGERVASTVEVLAGEPVEERAGGREVGCVAGRRGVLESVEVMAPLYATRPGARIGQVPDLSLSPRRSSVADSTRPWLHREQGGLGAGADTPSLV